MRRMVVWGRENEQMVNEKRKGVDTCMSGLVEWIDRWTARWLD